MSISASDYVPESLRGIVTPTGATSFAEGGSGSFDKDVEPGIREDDDDMNDEEDPTGRGGAAPMLAEQKRRQSPSPRSGSMERKKSYTSSVASIFGSKIDT